MRAFRFVMTVALVALTATPAIASDTMLPSDAASRVSATLGLTGCTLTRPVLADTADGLTVTLPVGNRSCRLLLTPYSVRSADYAIFEADAKGALHPVKPGPVRTVRGSVEGEPGSLVAGARREGTLTAMIDLGDGERWWVEPAGADAPGWHAVYRDADVAATGGTCAAQAAAGGIAGLAGPGGADGPTPAVAELACDADHDFFLAWGAATEDRVNSIVNQVNVQYERDVDITHEITTIIVRTAPTYVSTDAWTLVNEFRNRWLGNHGLVPRDAAHLFTGKDLDGNTIGIAYDTGRICTTGAYCLAQSDHAGGFACSTDITAHELGHLWGAGHCTCPSFTMNSTITCANIFSSVSIVDIIAHRDTRDCLDSTPPVVYCSAFSGSASFEHIARFALGDIDRPSGPSTYSSFLDDSTDLDRGATYAFTVTLGSAFSSDVGGVWIDWNQDGDFLDDDEAIDTSLSGAGPYVGVVVVPADAPLGPTRLRARIQDGTADPVPVSCGTTSFGEVEDYTIVVVASCPADLDGSGDVGFTDLITVLSLWGPCAGSCPADIDGSGDVGFTDVITVLSLWGVCS